MLINCDKYTSAGFFMASVKSEEFAALSAKLTGLGVERIAGLYDVTESFRGGA
jgi:hypothetical protein